MSPNTYLITGWNNNFPLLRSIEPTPYDTCCYIDYQTCRQWTRDGIPLCGNAQAGQGKMRIIVNGVVQLLDAQQANNIFQQVSPHLSLLGKKVLVSAGHFMPVKYDPSLVNNNSYQLLQDGINVLQHVITHGGEANLLITINDLALSPEEREAYYGEFQLPSLYKREINLLKEELGDVFSVLVARESQLSEHGRVPVGYTGFLQFLPLCGRNGLHSFSTPYISVHRTRSCF